MEKMRTLPTRYASMFLLAFALLLLVLGLAGCLGKAYQGRPSVQNTQAVVLPGNQQEATSTPSPVLSPTATQLPWPTFAAPSRASVTQVPDPAKQLAMDEDTRIWLLLGTDLEAPAVGRTDAIHLIFVNERLSKASVVSIPGSLFVFLPGHNMQRLNTAFALGGMPLMRDTLAYNFGLRPDRFVLAHTEEFAWLVDDLGGLDVSVLFPIRDDCDGIPSGLHRMDGKKTLCYVRYIKDGDEVNRVRRQQQILQLLFTKLVQDGRLAQLPAMYLSYQPKMETDVSLADFLQRIPLALRLGDPQRVSYFIIGMESVTLWELPDHTKTKVLLPRLEVVAKTFEQALDAVDDATPLGEVVVTYQWQLTQAIGGTQTQQPRQPNTTPGAPTRTRTPVPTRTPLPPVYTPGVATAVIETSTPETYP